MSVEQKVKEIVVDQLGISADEVKPEAKFVEDLGADSLDLTELIMAMEEEFDIEIDDEKAQELLTIQAVVDFIKANQ
ncbi:acyl carrier protein [Desulfonatronospira sp.]|uniref:acyl carrier protein n=1 Tax=Desulfonatronospira sp. TaxID=1962951 RepID=UPI0025BF00E2|nr:acyl carrier protein [Desulfonatronospira sp.]